MSMFTSRPLLPVEPVNDKVISNALHDRTGNVMSHNVIARRSVLRYPDILFQYSMLIYESQNKQEHLRPQKVNKVGFASLMRRVVVS